MARRQTKWWAILWCSGALLIAGCDWFDGAQEEEVEAPALVESLDEAPVQVAPPADPPRISPAPIQPAASSAAVIDAPLRATLVKTTVQQLRQRAPEGWIEGRSFLELTMLIGALPPGAGEPGAPSDPGDPRLRYQVRYQRIRLQEEFPGANPVAYDSDAPQAEVPPSARLYNGLKGNGFQFVLDRDRRLTEVAEFEPFVDRCLESIAPAQRSQFRPLLGEESPEQSVALLVDESIGLIPAGLSDPGATWMRSRRVAHPVAMTSTINYTLRQSTTEWADVDVVGTLGPVSEGDTDADPPAVQVRILGGRVRGECRLDRRNGLPHRSRIEQSLDMLVRLADGTQIEQFKATTTTLESRFDRSMTAPITLIGGSAPARPADRPAATQPGR